MASRENASVSLRHVIATLRSYRAGKNAIGTAGVWGISPRAPSTRRAIEIVGHMADLIGMGGDFVNGKTVWREGKVDRRDGKWHEFFPVPGLVTMNWPAASRLPARRRNYFGPAH